MNSGEKSTLNLTVKSTLETISAIRVAIGLWGKDDYRFNVQEMDNRCYDKDRWQNIENKVMENLKNPYLPKNLRDLITEAILPLALQIAAWMDEHDPIINAISIVKNHYDYIIWTTQGTINQKETAKNLVHDESLTLSISNLQVDPEREELLCRYQLSCLHSIEEDIEDLWHRLNLVDITEKELNDMKHEITIFWTKFLKSKYTETKAFDENRQLLLYEEGFLSAIRIFNKAGIEYFLSKLTPVKRGELIMESIRVIKSTHHRNGARAFILDHMNIFIILLRTLGEEQRITLYKHCSSALLLSILEWPWSKFFMDTAEHIWEYHREDQVFIASKIVRKAFMNFKDSDYSTLFQLYWMKIPFSIKDYDQNAILIAVILEILYRLDDRDAIKQILYAFSEAQMVSYIFYPKGDYPLKYFIHNQKPELLQFIFEECVESKAIVKALKQLPRTCFVGLPTVEAQDLDESFNLFYRTLDKVLVNLGKGTT